MVKGVGVETMQAKVGSQHSVEEASLVWTFLTAYHCRWGNSSLLEEVSHQRRSQSLLSTEWECSPLTQCSLSLSSGTTWRDSTKSGKYKVRSSQSKRSMRNTPASSRTTASFSDICPELKQSTCTRNSETPPSQALFPRCVSIYDNHVYMLVKPALLR